MPLLKNFKAAERKRHLKRFYLLHPSLDLSWIDAVNEAAVAPTIEVPSGTINGVNTDFTITTPSYTELIVTLNGRVLDLGQGYSLPSATTIRFAAGYIPQPSGVQGRTINDSIKAFIWV